MFAQYLTVTSVSELQHDVDWLSGISVKSVWTRRSMPEPRHDSMWTCCSGVNILISCKLLALSFTFTN